MTTRIIKQEQSLQNSYNVNWGELKLEFLASPYKQARTFIREHKDPAVHIIPYRIVDKHTKNWAMDKAEWEQEAIRLTMANLRESKARELELFIKEESAIVKQMMNIVKIGLNSLIKKKQYKGKSIYDITSSKDFKAIIEGSINVLKYNRGKLGVPFDKEDEVIDKQVNFNFDLVDLDSADPEKLFKFFTKKQDDRPTNKIQSNAIDSETVSNAEETSQRK